MNRDEKASKEALAKVESGFIDHFWEKSWTYIKTVVDVVHEPVLILDENLFVMAANESFYKTFQVKPKDTEQKNVYELGNGQWDIPALRKLLEGILPKSTFFKGFQVVHKFPTIGRKVMILNARQIFVKDDISFPPIILLAIEDVTEMMDVAEMLAHHTKQFETTMAEKTEELEDQIRVLKMEVNDLKMDRDGIQ